MEDGKKKGSFFGQLIGYAIVIAIILAITKGLWWGGKNMKLKRYIYERNKPLFYDLEGILPGQDEIVEDWLYDRPQHN